MGCGIGSVNFKGNLDMFFRAAHGTRMNRVKKIINKFTFKNLKFKELKIIVNVFDFF